MKKRFLLPTLLAISTMNMSAEEPYEHQPGYFESKETLFESEFSDWHLVSDMQIVFDRVSEEYFWVYQEGRNFNGVAQIRWIQRERPNSGFEDYRISGMLTHDDFYANDLRYQKSGYERISLQVFIDASGVARHQAVWVKRPPEEATAEQGGGGQAATRTESK